MNKVTLLSPMIGDGSDKSPFRAQFSDDYPLIGYEDVTAREAAEQPGVPSVVMIEGLCDDAQLALIEANSAYLVLDSEVINVEIPA